MKITESRLRRVIRRELIKEEILNEQDPTRRSFLKGLGAAVSSSLLPKNALAKKPITLYAFKKAFSSEIKRLNFQEKARLLVLVVKMSRDPQYSINDKDYNDLSSIFDNSDNYEHVLGLIKVLSNQEEAPAYFDNIKTSVRMNDLDPSSISELFPDDIQNLVKFEKIKAKLRKNNNGQERKIEVDGDKVRLFVWCDRFTEVWFFLDPDEKASMDHAGTTAATRIARRIDLSRFAVKDSNGKQCEGMNNPPGEEI